MNNILESVKREEILNNVASVIERFLQFRFDYLCANDQSLLPVKYSQEDLYDEVIEFWRNDSRPGTYVSTTSNVETLRVFKLGLRRLAKKGVIEINSREIPGGDTWDIYKVIEYTPRDDQKKPKNFHEANKEIWNRRQKAGDEILGILARHGIEFEYNSGGYHSSEKFVPKSIDHLEGLANLLRTRLK